LENSSPTADRL